MKYLRQFCIIIGISFLGEILHHLIPYPIPASIYGIVLLFIFLMTGIIKPQQIEGTAGFLIEIMPVMFIPAAAGLIESWTDLKPILIQTIVILMVTTVIVMAVTGKTAMFMIEREGRRHE